MIISTTAICERYRVIDTIMVLDQYKPGGFLGTKGFDFDQLFTGTKLKIEQKAEALGGNAVIGCDFEFRLAVGQMGGGQVFEVFCFGTVVELLE